MIVMKKGSVALIMIIVLSAGCSTGKMNAPDSYSIIPKPVEVVMLEGSFTIDKATELSVSPLTPETEKAAGFLAALLRRSTLFPLPLNERSGAGRNSITLLIDTAAGTGEDGYLLEVTAKKIVLRSPSASGLFHGVQTLRQLV